MYSVPAPILNAIARTQSLRSEWARQVFSLDAEGVLTALSRQAKELATQGVPNKVLLAYQTMGPLLIENIAISEYIMATEHLELRSCLPEIVSVQEAILVADAEYRLTDDGKDLLAEMLPALEDSSDES
jgi:hypothetical protein